MNKRILAVDDEPDTVELVQFNLHRAGFDVVAAADGAEALRKARFGSRFDRAGPDVAGD
jgi:two-component system alkaline phosphatase synthesis response regulator PhoP